MMPTVEILPYRGCQKENLNSKVSKISGIITTVVRYLISTLLFSDIYTVVERFLSDRCSTRAQRESSVKLKEDHS